MVVNKTTKTVIGLSAIGALAYYLSTSGLLSTNSSGSFGSVGGGESTNIGEDGISGVTEDGTTYNINIPENDTSWITDFLKAGETNTTKKTDNSANQLLTVKDVSIPQVLDVAGANDYIASIGGTVSPLSESVNLSGSAKYNESTQGDMGASTIGNLTTGQSITERIIESNKSSNSGGTGTVTKKEAATPTNDYGASSLGQMTTGTGSITEQLSAIASAGNTNTTKKSSNSSSSTKTTSSTSSTKSSGTDIHGRSPANEKKK